MGEELKKCPCDSLLKAQDAIAKVNEDYHEMKTLVEVFKVRLETIAGDTAEIKLTLKGIESRPVKKWDMLMETVIKWLTIALLVIAAGKIGLN